MIDFNAKRSNDRFGFNDVFYWIMSGWVHRDGVLTFSFPKRSNAFGVHFSPVGNKADSPPLLQ